MYFRHQSLLRFPREFEDIPTESLELKEESLITKLVAPSSIILTEPRSGTFIFYSKRIW